MRLLARGVGGVAVAVAIVACAQSNGSASADTARSDSSRLVGSAGLSVETQRPAARPVDTAPPVGTRGGERKESGSIPSAGHAASARGGARVTGGPQKPPVPPRSSGCGGTAVNVTVKASALGGSPDAEGTMQALRSVSSRILAPVRDAVGAPSISPAIRAFRVPIEDASATQRVLAQLRSSPQVEHVELDDCAVMIKR
jgi:hypothetical protein